MNKSLDFLKVIYFWEIWKKKTSQKTRRLSLPMEREAGRILEVRNLPRGVTGEELLALFGRFGSVFQVRLGVTKETRGRAFVVFTSPGACRAARRSLSGLHMGKRALAVLPGPTRASSL